MRRTKQQGTAVIDNKAPEPAPVPVVSVPGPYRFIGARRSSFSSTLPNVPSPLHEKAAIEKSLSCDLKTEKEQGVSEGKVKTDTKDSKPSVPALTFDRAFFDKKDTGKEIADPDSLEHSPHYHSPKKTRASGKGREVSRAKASEAENSSISSREQPSAFKPG